MPYGYFDSKQDLLITLLEDDTAALDRELEQITRTNRSAVERVRRFAEATLARADDSGRVQVRADLWAALLTDEVVRHRLAEATQRRREMVRTWIEHGIASAARSTCCSTGSGRDQRHGDSAATAPDR